MNNLNHQFINASNLGQLEELTFLVSLPAGVNPTANHDSAIQCASKNVEVVKFLVSLPEVNPIEDDNSAIQWASANGHLEVV